MVKPLAFARIKHSLGSAAAAAASARPLKVNRCLLSNVSVHKPSATLGDA